MHRQLTSMTLVLLAVSAPPFVQAQGDKHAFTFDDWVALRTTVPIAVGADGKTILYRVDSGVAKVEPVTNGKSSTRTVPPRVRWNSRMTSPRLGSPVTGPSMARIKSTR